MDTAISRAAEGFRLGPVDAAVPVAGGLSNDLWRVTTTDGTFAVKVMRANAGAHGFRENIEAACRIELAAHRAGVPSPQPLLTEDGSALLLADGLWLRAHRWRDGRVPRAGEHPEDAGELLAEIHAVGARGSGTLTDAPVDAARWNALAAMPGLMAPVRDRLATAAGRLARLEVATTTRSEVVTAFSDSHGDLDPKNTLVSSGRLLALDWDAAGPRSDVREAIALALDWSEDLAGFGRVLAAFRTASSTVLPAEPWVFGGWVQALTGWLAFNVEQRADTELGRREASATCARLLAFHSALDDHLDVLGTFR